MWINSQGRGKSMRRKTTDPTSAPKTPSPMLDHRRTPRSRISKAATHPGRGPSLPLSGYASVYRDPWYGTATISQGKKGTGGLSISFDRTPGLHGTLEHVQYDTFRTHWAMPDVEDAYVTFALKPDGGVDRMTMKAISPTADFSWDYQDLHFVPVADGK